MLQALTKSLWFQVESLAALNVHFLYFKKTMWKAKVYHMVIAFPSEVRCYEMVQSGSQGTLWFVVSHRDGHYSRRWKYPLITRVGG